MSEKSLEIREKYISKMLKTVGALQEKVALLGKVDNRLISKKMQSGGAVLQRLNYMKSNLRQRGGADEDEKVNFKGLEEQALIAKLKLKQQHKALEDARQTIEKLNGNLSNIKQTISQLAELMKGLNFDFKKLDLPKPVSLTSYGEVAMYNAYHNVDFDKIEILPANTLNASLEIDPKGDGSNKFNGPFPQNAEADYNELRKSLHNNSASASSSAQPATGPATGPASGPNPEASEAAKASTGPATGVDEAAKAANPKTNKYRFF